MRLSELVAGFLLFWFLVPAPLTLIESFQAALPPGILDGDDDDDAIAALSNLDLKIAATIPSPPLEPVRPVVRAADAEVAYRPLFAATITTLSRSPPIS